MVDEKDEEEEDSGTGDEGDCDGEWGQVARLGMDETCERSVGWAPPGQGRPRISLLQTVRLYCTKHKLRLALERSSGFKTIVSTVCSLVLALRHYRA